MEQVKVAESKAIEVVADEPNPKLSENALRVLEKRYLKKDDQGRVIETPRELFARVAWNLAQAEANYGADQTRVEETARRFYRIIANLEFLPNSPTLMNAGLELQQLSACFVLPVDDSLAGIFQTLKESALIHQSGGGCVSGDAHVFTTFCGVERFETLYNRVRSLGLPEQIGAGYKVMDISDLGVQTFAVDPATGKFAAKAVTHLWRWEVEAEKQYRIRCSDGTEVTTSEWHPFLVLSEAGLAKRRADALKPGDVLLTANRSVQEAWPFKTYLEREGFSLDERLAWLTGFFLGDGSLGWFNNRRTAYRALRLRLFDGRPENIRFAQDVLAGHGIALTPRQDNRGLWSLTTTNQRFVPRFARIAQAEPGPKEALTVPEWVMKSPLSVVAAFLGGLIDSEGYVSLKRRRLEFSTVCLELARRLVSLLSALGLNPSIRAKPPDAKARHVEYRVHMADAKKTPELVALVREWVHDPLRGRRLELLTERVAHNTHPRIPVPFALLEKLLCAAGVPTRTTAIHKSALTVGGTRLWLHHAKWGNGIGEDKLRRLVRALRPLVSGEYRPLLDQLDHLADGWASVESVERAAAKPTTFYDLTVADFNNYLAGGGLGKLAVVHNTGFSFSRLRPKNDFVKSTMGVASGPVSFMRVFDAATQQVKQGSKRRGANMGILRVDHPDILEFITCKDKTTEITNFNISVAVTDKFMEAMKAGTEYDLVNPRSKQVAGQLDAREVLDKIAFQAWKNGEPGLFFIDENNRRQPTPNVGDMEATNPCVTGDTLISTERGLTRISELVERYPDGGISLVTDRRVPAEVVTESNGLLLASRDEAERGTRLGPMVAAWRTGVKPVWRLVTKSGFELTATADHKVLTTEGWVKVEDLVPGHRLLIQSGEGKFPEARGLPFAPTNVYIGRNGKTTVLNLPTEWSRELGLALGWLVGDGWLRSGDKNCRVGFTFARDDAPMFATLRPILNRWYGRNIRGVRRANGVYHLSYHSRFFVDFFEGLGVRPMDSSMKEVPAAVFSAPRDSVLAFLQALFSADGTVRDSPKSNSSWIALTSKSRRLLQGVQLLLLNLGIKSQILDRSRAPRATGFQHTRKDGTSMSYGSDGILYELAIFGESRHRFLTEIGFFDEKQARLASVRFRGFRPSKYEDLVVAKEHVGEREVFDLTEAMSHSMICNGIVVRQCGEQPLLPYESCNLGSIDLARHMKRSAAGRWEVDWTKLERSIRTAARMLDDVIDMNAYPVKQIEEMTRATRKIGLGVMGFARMLFMLEVPYDSSEGVEWGRKIMKFFQETGYDESAKLAEERGVYPAWDGSRHQEMGLKLRNSYVTTVAPTGTLSMIADTSGGCEPEFSLIWYKRVMDGEELPYFLDYFEEVAKREGFWREDLVKKILDNHGSPRGLRDVPEKWQRVFAVAHDVAPEWHVRMQAAFQDHCDAAVSKTINLPREATVDDVKKAYLLAYELKCKGITVYRDGSREDQVLNIGVAEAEKPKEVRVEVPAEAAALRPRARPDVITGRTQKILTGYGALYVTINEDERGLFEVFAQIGRGGGYTASFTEGIARLVSLCLRSGVPVDEIIDQLEGIRSPRIAVDHGERVYSIPDAIAKAIKRHIGMQKTGVVPPVETFDELGGVVETDVELEKESREAAEMLKKGLNPECPECGKSLVFEEGCVKCHSCGYSEC